jgi:molecular chaperone GrpE (heat shock protein)
MPTIAEPKKWQQTFVSKSDQEVIANALNSLTDAADCMRLAAAVHAFSFKNFDLYHGRVGVLKYRGVEIALFFKRSMEKVSIEECDPTSPAQTTERSSWIRMDLNVPSIWHQKQALLKTLKAEVALTSQEKVVYEKRIGELNQKILQMERDNVSSLASFLNDFWMELLPIYDAVQNLNGTLKNIMESMLVKAAKKCSAEIVFPMRGEAFNPQIHQAVNLSGEVEKGKVSHTLSAGLVLSGKLLKPANVTVGSKEIRQ